MHANAPADTVDPRVLADSDSCFAAIDGVSIHFKERVADASEAPPSSSSGAASRSYVDAVSGVRVTTALGGGISEAAAASTSGRTPLLLFHGFNGSTFNW